LLGPIVGLLILAAISADHKIVVPYCGKCWWRYQAAGFAIGATMILFFAAIVGGVTMMLQFDSGYLFFPLPIFSIALVAMAVVMRNRFLPPIIYADKSQVVVDCGEYGHVSFKNMLVATPEVTSSWRR